MSKDHMKRIAAPKTWPIARKMSTFVTRPKPGSHNLMTSIPLGTFMKEMIELTKTNKENKFIITHKEVLVNGNKVRDMRRPVGLMDVITFTETKDSYRILLTEKGKLKAVKIDEKHSKIRPVRIDDKQLSKSKKTNLRFFDGTNMIVEKDEYKTGDTVVIGVYEKKITERFGFEKGMLAYLIGGSHIGQIGKIVEIDGTKIVCETKAKTKFETLKKFAFIIGKDKPVITISEEIVKE